MNRKHDIETFLNSNRIALVGLSRDPKSYSRMVMYELQKRGYSIVGVTPNSTRIDDVNCFPSLDALPEPVDAALILMSPKKSDELLRSCLDAKIKIVWIRGKEGKQSVRKEMIDECESNGISLIDGYCPLMFLQSVGFPHNLHRTFATWIGKMPK